VPKRPSDPLSRRERQIMDIIYSRRQASAAEVRDDLPDPPSYSAVRALLRILEEKGHLKHIEDGARYIYLPSRSREVERHRALGRVVQTFFEGLLGKTIVHLANGNLSEEELDRINQMIEQARREGR
jgi:predicted transcriptional regulator